jgi:hypothetical protein
MEAVELLRASAARGVVVALRRGMVSVQPADLALQGELMAVAGTPAGKRALEGATAAMDDLRGLVGADKLRAACARMDAGDLRSVLAAFLGGARAGAADCVRWYASGCVAPRWKQ